VNKTQIKAGCDKKTPDQAAAGTGALGTTSETQTNHPSREGEQQPRTESEEACQRTENGAGSACLTKLLHQNQVVRTEEARAGENRPEILQKKQAP
jgi:hypothetical protein